MLDIAISARQSAPTDGRDPFTGGGFYTSKQNSDAGGMFYQWGHKDPFTFAISSESNVSHYGKYPVKIYTIDGVLLYQENDGSSNKDKQPTGGIIMSSIIATSMMETIKNPNTFYANPVINQIAHTKSLWDYYWTSYSRGTDGKWNPNTLSWHNVYLDGYASQRLKSIYDPCPYGYRVSPNGTFNQFDFNKNWTIWSYIGGASWNTGITASWFPDMGVRNSWSSIYSETGRWGFYYSSTPDDASCGYGFSFSSALVIRRNQNAHNRSYGFFVRCIEFFVSPPRPTDETRLAVQEVFIPVSKTVMLMGCVISGDVKTRLCLQ